MNNNIQLIHGDCLVEMQRIPDKSIDMILCDLPYGVLHKNNPHTQWDRIIPFDKLWEQYERIIKDNGAIVLFAQGMFTAKLMMSNTKLWRYNLVWDKQRTTGFLNANRMPLRCHEDICVFYKSLPTYNPQYTDGEPNHARGNGKHKNTNQCYGKYKADYKKNRCYEQVPRVDSTVPEGKKLPRSIISIKKEHESTTVHPTQKSVELLEYLIKTFTNEQDTVLDNTMGSGSTLVACINTNRKGIGIELNEDYFKIAQNRVKNTLQQPKLF
jgi:site-specific DNA-methyltransferase (adenine-specific)